MLDEFFSKRKKPDYSTELSRYKEIQRRRKLLYGVKDVRKLMIDKMDD